MLVHWNNSPRIDSRVAPLGHIVVIPRQPVCSFSWMLRAFWRSNKCQFYQSFVWQDRGSNPQSTTLEASTLTITPTMWWLSYSHSRCTSSHVIPILETVYVHSSQLQIRYNDRKLTIQWIFTLNHLKANKNEKKYCDRFSSYSIKWSNVLSYFRSKKVWYFLVV